MKKFVTLLLALVMILSMAVTASAASITITPPTVPEGASESGITYNAYKIFDATITYKTVEGKQEIDKVAYTIDSTSPYYRTIAAATNYFTLTQVGESNTYVVTAKDAYTSDAANTFADTLKAVTGATVAGTTNSKTSNTISNLADGYYLVTSSVGSDLILDTIGDITVNTKNTYPSIDKKVEGKGDYTTADMGATLNFTIDVTIPEDAVGEIVVHDKMNGLSYQSMTAVTGQSDVSTGLRDDCAVEFTLSETYVAANKGTTVTIAYTAKLTADVANNETWLVDDTFTSKNDGVKVYSTDVVINKVVAGDETPLAGAKFVLKNSADQYYKVDGSGNVTWVDAQADATVVETDATGAAKFENIADGIYYLVETEAPAGYNQLTAPVNVTVKATTKTEGNVTTVNDVTVKVENSAGTELPSTGGMGTTMFYVFGGILVLAAVILLVSKKRMTSAE